MNGHVWYSFNSDVTGQALAEALGFPHSKRKPEFDGIDVLVCWGTKPGEKYKPGPLATRIAKGDIRVVNHPDAIANNRNKLQTLETLRAGGVPTGQVVSIKGLTPSNALQRVTEAIQNGELIFPIIGLNEYGKGKPAFCQTAEDLRQITAINSSRKKDAVKLHYFRSFFPGTEYRVHVFRDEALCAEQKQLSKDPVKATSAALFKRTQRRAQKEGWNFTATEGDVEQLTRELAVDLLGGPSHLQRSTAHGWELTSVDLKTVPKEVVAAAITAVEVAGLDMGAVNVIFYEDQPLVTSITTAPGLSEEQTKSYVAALKDFSKASNSSKKKEEKPAAAAAAVADEEKASPEILARITRRIRHGKISAKKAEEVLKNLGE